MGRRRCRRDGSASFRIHHFGFNDLTNHCAEPEKLIQIGGFPEIAGNAETADALAVLWRIGGTDDNDRRTKAPGVFPEFGEDGQAVRLGQIEIEKEKIGTRRL